MRLAPSSLLLVACSGAQHPAEPECSADAAIVIAGQDDVDRAARCLTVESVTIKTGAALDLAPLEKLHVILGELRVGPTVGLTALRLPELHSAGELVIANNHDLRGIHLPKLVTVRAMTIEDNHALTTIAMPMLAKVGNIAFANNADLEHVGVESLAEVGELRLVASPKLVLFEAGKLERAAAVVVENTLLDQELVQTLKAKVAP